MTPSSQEDAEQPVTAVGMEKVAAGGVKPTARRQLVDGLLQEHKYLRLARKRSKEDVDSQALKIAIHLPQRCRS